MKQEALTTIKGGLSRQRTKGGALKDQLYDLLNGYVTTEKTIKSRPGTTLDDTLPSGTVGLTHHDGEFQVFAETDVSSIPSGYNLNIVRAPEAETQPTLSKIHFAEPFLGALYVAAEFSDGNIYHYWLRDSDDWEADTIYELGDLVNPTTPDGFVYRATRGTDKNPLWVANTPRSVSDKVEPTTPNGYYFEVSQVFGSAGISGGTEPAWTDPSEGELFVDSADGTPAPPDPDPGADTTTERTIGETREDRYGRDRRLP